MYSKFAWVTVATKQEYVVSAGRLYQALNYYKSKYPLEILVSNDHTRKDLTFLITNKIPFKKMDKLVFTRTDKTDPYHDTLSKFKLLELIKYDYLCFIDADIILMQNIDSIWNVINFNFDFNCCFRKNNLQRFCGELFFAKPNKKLLDTLVQRYFINSDYNEQDDESILKNYLGDLIFINTKIADYLYDINFCIHFSGAPKFWTLLWVQKLYEWFYQAPFEIFISELKLNLVEIQKFHTQLVQINDYQLTTLLNKWMDHN